MVPRLNEDFVDFLEALSEHQVEHLVVDAFAMAVHGVARSTGDIDVWVRPEANNATRLVAALEAFGAPLTAHGVDEGTFLRPGVVYQIGLPPSRIDILTRIDGVSFDEAWEARATARFGDLEVPVLGLDEWRANKAATGRDKDIADLALLDEVFKKT